MPKMTIRNPATNRLLCGIALVIAAAVLVGSCTHREGGRGHSRYAPLYASEAHSDHGMVSTGSVEATRAGVQILEQGGNAVDAAVAAAFALGVADPGGSGLGGMTYILISLSDGRAMAVDGSATVPLAADPAMLLELQKSGGRFGAKAVAVPATLAALSYALERYGTIELGEVLAPAIEIAERGYRLSPNSIAWATGYLDDILASEYLRFVVLDGGDQPGSAGDLVCRPDLASTLRRLSKEGPGSFYRGSIARRMVIHLATLGGFVQPVDLSTVRAREIQPLQSHYRGAEVLSYPLPGGGGEVAEALNILQTFPRDFLGENSVDRLHVMVETFRIAQIDHLLFAQGLTGLSMGTIGHLSEQFARERAELITPGRAIPEDVLSTTGTTLRMGEHTTQVSVADRWGNAVSLTQTLCRQYGAKVATPGLGFPYNSCLEFFDYENPESPFYLRPRGRYTSTMAPTIVRRDGELLILGSAGSDRIPPSVTEVISNVIDRDMSIRDAVVAPRVLWNSAHNPHRVCIEIADPITNRDADRLQSFGFEHMYRLEYPPIPLSNSAFFGGVNAVLYDPATGVFSGVGDPRRNGFALGPRTVAEPLLEE